MSITDTACSGDCFIPPESKIEMNLIMLMVLSQALLITSKIRDIVIISQFEGETLMFIHVLFWIIAVSFCHAVDVKNYQNTAIYAFVNLLSSLIIFTDLVWCKKIVRNSKLLDSFVVLSRSMMKVTVAQFLFCAYRSCMYDRIEGNVIYEQCLVVAAAATILYMIRMCLVTKQKFKAIENYYLMKRTAK